MRRWSATEYLIANDFNVYAVAEQLGDTVATVKHHYLEKARAREATNLTVNATSSHPSLWQERFETQLVEAGLTAGHGFETATGDGWARVDVWGMMDPDPASKRYDVAVDLGVQHTDVTLAR